MKRHNGEWTEAKALEYRRPTPPPPQVILVLVPCATTEECARKATATPEPES